MKYIKPIKVRVSTGINIGTATCIDKGDVLVDFNLHKIETGTMMSIGLV